MPQAAQAGERIFKGIPASDGVSRGRLFILQQKGGEIPHYSVPETDLPAETARLQRALVETRRQIDSVQKQVADAMGEKDALIFEAQMLILDDPTLIDGVTRALHEEHCNVEHAWAKVSDRYISALSAVDDDYLRERIADLRDVSQRLISNLKGTGEHLEMPSLPEPCVLACHDLAPSMTALLDKEKVLGFATESGGQTSHTAILARSLRIPAVVGLQGFTEHVKAGDVVLLDGFNGLLILNPTDQTLFEYGQIVRKQLGVEEALREVRDLPAITLDGVRVTLSANVQQADEAVEVKASGSEGVGLFRSEYLFVHRNSLPSEEEQFQEYNRAAESLKPEPVVIRTLDLGGDKFVPQLKMPHELNPFLGWRAIRFCLHERDLFRCQLRAILRASVHGNVKIMYPMVSGLDELNQANALLEECKAELRQEGQPFKEDIEIGAMIEIPSAVMVADALAKRVRFFSLGTNDLIQYALAVDRLNEKIAHLYEPTNPAILRLIRMTVEAAHTHGIWVGLCGEMAGDVALVPLLIGLGVDELSVAPPAVPRVKFLIRRLKASDARALADFALNCESGVEILDRSRALARSAAPTLFGNTSIP